MINVNVGCNELLAQRDFTAVSLAIRCRSCRSKSCLVLFNQRISSKNSTASYMFTENRLIDLYLWKFGHLKELI